MRTSPGAPSDRSTDPRPCVLVIDDDLEPFDLDVFLEHGFGVIHTTRGDSGYAAARAERPDVIVVDAQLPDVDGLELCSRLLHDQRTASIPLIVWTSDAHAYARAKVLPGVEAVVKRPCPTVDILVALRGALRQETTPAEPGDRVIVIIEDDAGYREALSRVLEVKGFQTMRFASAEEYLSAASTLTPLCVVVDINLPGLSGLQLLQRMQRQAGPPPVIVMTADRAPSLRQQAEDLGCAGYFSKPFSAAALVAAIRALAARP